MTAASLVPLWAVYDVTAVNARSTSESGQAQRISASWRSTSRAAKSIASQDAAAGFNNFHDAKHRQALQHLLQTDLQAGCLTVNLKGLTVARLPSRDIVGPGGMI